MPSIYPKGGKLYAPAWTCDGCGVVAAHSLRTGDRAAAERAWLYERAQHASGDHFVAKGTVAQSVELPTFNRRVAGSSPAGPTLRVRLSDAFDAYLLHKRHNITPATLGAYEGYARQIMATLGDPLIGELPAKLPRWVDDEIDRLLGRRATVVKRLEALIKPAIRYAFERNGHAVPFVFPEVATDYKSAGIREGWLSRQEFAALRAELPEVSALEIVDGERHMAISPTVVYPRFWCDLAVTTGLHSSDVDDFTAADFNVAAGVWRRDNTKNAKHYRAEWLRCTPYMIERFREHVLRRDLVGGARMVGTGNLPLPQQWMRRRLIWAAKRAGLSWVPAPIDFRRTCAQWAREDGWTYPQTAKWLANSSGIVAQVYAPTPVAEIDVAVAHSARANHKLIAITNAVQGHRRPAHQAFGQSVVHGSKVGSRPTKRKALTHGKQSI